jgi:hypothetical protein
MINGIMEGIIPFMVVYTCKKCGEPNYLTPYAFWNISDFGALICFCLSLLEIYHICLSKSGSMHTDLVDKSFKSPGLDLNQRSLPYQDNALPN